MKLRNIVLACAVMLAVVFIKTERADAGGYVSVSPYGVHIGSGKGYYYPRHRVRRYYRPYYYYPYYGYRSYYYRPYRKHYYGSYYYPYYGYNYRKWRHRKYRRHSRRHWRYRNHYRRW